MRKFFLKWGRKLGHYSNHWWYGPLIGLVAALDAFIFVISNEAILFPTVWARPQKWFSTATWLTLGSAVGATAFACLTSSYGAGVVEHFFPHALDTHSWKETVMFIDRYGAWGLAIAPTRGRRRGRFGSYEILDGFWGDHVRSGSQVYSSGLDRDPHSETPQKMASHSARRNK